MFRRFWRGGGATQKAGSGIGLWLSAQLAEVLGGRIRLTSDGRSGSRFDLCLPLEPALNKEEPVDA